LIRVHSRLESLLLFLSVLTSFSDFPHERRKQSRFRYVQQGRNVERVNKEVQ